MTGPAGGRATEAGMAFQAAVATWFAAYILARQPVGERFGLAVDALPVSIRLETGSNLDDLDVGLADGGHIYLQCKTNPSLATAPDSDLGKTIAQVDALVSTADPTVLSRSAAVMAVASTAPSTLGRLHTACRCFDMGGGWGEVLQGLNGEQQSAIDLFRAHLDAARLLAQRPPATDAETATIARLFRIERFEPDQGGRDWREAGNILGQRIYGDSARGAGPLSALAAIVRGLIRNGASATREGLLDALRRAGHDDSSSPGFDRDIDALRRRTDSELARIGRHSQLPLAGCAIQRTCTPELRRVAEEGSILVVGEPGAGKTGVLVDLARQRLASALPTVVISTDDLSWVASRDALSRGLGLGNDIVEVLAAWPGVRHGVLIIDALDAARSGPGEGVFASLIEEVAARLKDRWTVVASIRTFDLRNTRRFREAMPGGPPVPAYVDPAVRAVRHFAIPLLDDAELNSLEVQDARLAQLFASASDGVRTLLRNVFNLSLAAALLDDGVSADSISTIATQSDLIDRYEDERLTVSQHHALMARVIGQMVEQRLLLVRKADIDHARLDEVLAAGVLAADGDRVRFTHHVLFDHAAGRFFLDWNNPAKLIAQASGRDGTGLLLGPALRFALERIWREDDAARTRSWRLSLDLASADAIDPILANVALRSAVERVRAPDDVHGLRDLLRTRGAAEVARPLSTIARFAAISIKGAPAPPAAVEAWASIAAASALTGAFDYADAVRILLMTLMEVADSFRAEIMKLSGEAARALLTMAWDAPQAWSGLATNAIRFVTWSFASDPLHSRELLQRIMEDPRFSQHAHEEMPWLAEGMKHIIPADPAFAVTVYEEYFGKECPTEGQSWLGGQPSRILPLVSNRRQDYDHGRWHLKRAMAGFLRSDPAHATRAVSAAAIGGGQRRRPLAAGGREHTHDLGDRTVCIVDDSQSFFAWRGEAQRVHSEPEVLSAFAEFLRVSSAEEFRLAVRTLSAEPSSASAWARVFGIAIDRPGVADDLLWPIATHPDIGRHHDLECDVADYLAAAYPAQSQDARAAFEARLAADASGEDDSPNNAIYWAARLLAVIPDASLVTSQIRELKGRLTDAGYISGNRPRMTIGNASPDHEDITASLLAHQGVDVNSEIERRALQAKADVERLITCADPVAKPEQIATLWSSVSAALAILDGLDPQPHPATQQALLGIISNATELVCRSDNYSPGTDGQPSLDVMIAVLDRLVACPFPETPAS